MNDLLVPPYGAGVWQAEPALVAEVYFTASSEPTGDEELDMWEEWSVVGDIGAHSVTMLKC
jgi:hypothetical protein